MSRKLLAAVVFPITALSATAWGQAVEIHTRPPEVEKRISELRDEFARGSQPDEASQRRKTTVQALIAVVKSESKPSVDSYLLKSWAIGRLSQFPEDSDAVGTLVNEIDFGGDAIARDWALGPYPAAVALVKIGVPARKHILLALGNPQPDHKLHLMAYVLMELDEGGELMGLDVSMTVFRLTRELELVKNAQYIRSNVRDTKSDNFRRMITMLLEPGFRVKPIPPKPKDSPGSKRTASEESLIEQFLEQQRRKQP